MNNYRYVFAIRSLTGGGAERVVSVLASKLAQKGYDVHIIVYELTNSDYALDSKVNLHVLKKPEKNNTKFKQKVSRFYYMRKKIDELNPNIVIPFIGTVVDVAFFATRFKKCKFISTIRNNPSIQPANTLARYWRNYINLRSDAIFVQNEIQKKYYPKFMQKNIFVLPNPVSDMFLQSSYENKTEIKNIISIGRLTEQKNHLMLLEAFSIVKEKFPMIKLTIYGEGKLRDKLLQRIEELNLMKNVVLYGRCNDMGLELKKADLFVMSSDYEGMPNALMECMAMGIPCISTNCPTGPAELIVNNKGGILVDVNNKDELANAIIYMIENPINAIDMAKYSKKKIQERYSEDVITEKFIQLLRLYLKI